VNDGNCSVNGATKASELPLVLEILSFSYLAGIPRDETGHGGGFVFDCRCLSNPGEEARFSDKTGKHREVRDYLEADPAVEKYYNSVLSLVRQAISSYQDREFHHLMIAFGCTGGQHRSVYMAERLAGDLQKQGICTEVRHKCCDRWPGQ